MSEKEVVDESTGEIVVAQPVATPVKYDPKNPVSLYMDGSVFHQVGLVARTMAASQLVPEHLRGQPADCFLVVAQAVRWGMDPFAVAQSCYVARGKVGYEGKLIAALINRGLGKKLNYEYTGDPGTKKRGVRVYGTLKGEEKPREISGDIEKWATNNSQWNTMPDQMLAYRGAREWARRHMPEAVLGIYSDDEVQEIERQEAKAEIGPVVDEIIAADAKTQDDPPEQERKSSSEKAVNEDETEQKPAKKTGVRRYKPGDTTPDGRIVEEVDDEGRPSVVSRPKKAKAKAKPKAEPEPEPEPEPAPKASSDLDDADDVPAMTEEEIDALFG